MDKSNVKIVKARCNMCHPRCGINAYVENGKIVKVEGMPEHPWNLLCPKGRAIPELVHSPDRLTNPLKKINGEFKEISWNEAFGFVADKLADIKQRYGAKSIVMHVAIPYIGTINAPLFRRWTDILGTPNYTSGGSFCWQARTLGFSLTAGGHLCPDYDSSTRCVVVWGHNPTVTHPILADHINVLKGRGAWADHINVLKGRGAKLIVIDPLTIPLAKIADIHAQVRPGTDCALALSMLNVIIAEELYDKEFVEQWTVGFDKLVEHVKEYTPERTEGITWVPAEAIRNMARMYATNKPAIISLGIATDQSTNGIQAIRAIAILASITGNLDVPGGNLIPPPPMRQTYVRIPEKTAEAAKEPPISPEYPLFSKMYGEQQTTPLLDVMLTEKPYPVKAILDFGCNIALTWPDTNKVKKAFERLDLFVVCDTFMTETAKMADVVLPGVTFMEREDLRDYRNMGIVLLMITGKAVEPIGNSMEDWKIVQGIARKMGDGEYFPWENSEELFKYVLEPSPISYEKFKQNPGGVYYAEKIYRKYLNGGFNTPSKKVELYSQTLKELGYEPLPTFHEPVESPVATPDLAKDYPLILITGVKVLPYTHSQYHNLPSMRKMVPEPYVKIHPDTAAPYGIAQGDMVRVETPRGSIKLKANLTEDILPRVVSVMHGWSEANVNLLTTMDKEYRDPISGYPGLRQLLCRVRKAE
jgi:anaerobic selenocysteine-containing dehydrogenase